MTEKEKMLNGRLYRAFDNELRILRAQAKKHTYEYNHLAPDQQERRDILLRQLLGQTGNYLYIEPPFNCDYGCNITVGNFFYANTNCVILDAAPVSIGNHVLMGPNVSLYTTGHPVDPDLRNAGWEHAAPITIGNNVWIGGNTVILPGVTIGNSTVIGAGSVVTRDIPGLVIAAGNPCRVLRPITEQDKHCYFKGQPLIPE